MLANSGQMWFYHAPSKRSEKPQQLVPPASQVPGLAALDPLDEEAWRREVGIRPQKQTQESDSKYIRLAKQGGRKNLLMFNAKSNISDEPQPYPRVDWFDHQNCDPEKDKKILAQSSWQPPEYMVHEYDTSQTPEDVGTQGKRKRAPFYSDNKSVWERANDESKEMKTKKRKSRTTKLPKIEARKQKSDPTTFSKLIGGEYGTEWRQKQSGHRTIHMEPGNGKGYLDMTEYQEGICKKAIPPKKLKPIILQSTRRTQPAVKHESKEPFKLTKFNKIPSKLNTQTKTEIGA